MATDLKSIRVLEFKGKIADWEGWAAKFLARGKRLGYKKLLLGREEIPTESEYAKAVTDKDKPTVKRGELNKQAYEDIILSINHTSGQGKGAFSIVKNCVSDEYYEGNCKLLWDRLVAKYLPKTALSLLKLKKKFHNIRLESEDKHPDEWIMDL